MVNRQTRIIRFGMFEADLGAGELKKAGSLVRLQEQPFRLLTLLLERAGEVVSREEVRQELWPSDTFVDFDRSLNTAVNKIREALGDSAENPLFIQTLPRRGYRFIYPLPGNAPETTLPNAAPAPRPSNRRWGILAVAGATVLLATLTVMLVTQRRSTSSPPSKLVTFIVPPPNDKTVITRAEVSPDGSQIALTTSDGTGKSALWIRTLDSPAPRLLAGTEGAYAPFWSPDSRSIAFSVALRLYKVEASGGPVQMLCGDCDVAGSAWARDGTILFTRNLDGIYRLPAGGGSAQPFTKLDIAKEESRHYWPSILPDDRHFLYACTSTFPEVRGLWLASLANPAEKRRLLPDVSMGVYSSGHLLFVRSGALMAQPFDLHRLELSGEAVPVVDHVSSDNVAGWAQFSASVNGTLAVMGIGRPGHVSQGRLTWYDRAGKPLGAFGAPGRYQFISLSPDETRVAVDAKTETEPSYQILVMDPARQTTTQVTFGTATGNFPVWSPDGALLAFGSNRDGFYDLYVKPSTGAGQERLLLKNDANKFIYDWSRDGRYIIYSERKRGSYPADIWVLPMFGDRKPILYLHGNSILRDARFSPDGRWVVYASNESSRSQIYVQSFPAGSDKVQISPAGGTRPRWRPDGKELYYVAPDGMLMAVDVKVGAHFAAGEPKPLFKMVSSFIEHGYAPARGGQRFVMLDPGDDPSEPLTVALNWTNLIKPAGRK